MDPADVPGYPPLPEWVDPTRPQWARQVEVIERILAAYDNGAEVVFLDAPTGSGKTLIAEVVRRYLAQRQRIERAYYICSTKSLQDQFVADFPYAKVLKGRSNYPTIGYPDEFPRITAADCDKASYDYKFCSMCGDREAITTCPYEQAKASALGSDLVVVNTAYFMTEANYIGRLHQNAKAEDISDHIFGIVDECDTLESSLMGHVELTIPLGLRRELGLELPGKKTVEEAWQRWADESHPIVAAYVKRLEGITQNGDAGERQDNLKKLRQARTVLSSLGTLRATLSSGIWVYTGYENGGKTLAFKPARVDQFGTSKVFAYADKWLLMSATIISPDELAGSLGLRNRHWELVSMTSTFPAESRKLHVVNTGYMTKEQKPKTWPKMAVACYQVMNAHPDERILVHAVSYELSDYLAGLAGKHAHRIITYHNAREREEALEQYKATPGAVLIAPSFERGIDLPDDLCRVQVVCKVPYPYLGDKQVSKRLHSEGGELWYKVQTVRSLVQMTGRGVRHDSDYCTTYILDSMFISLWNKSKDLIPKWWSSAIDWSGQALKQATQQQQKEQATCPTK